MLTLERPDEFAALVLAFLAEVESAPRRPGVAVPR
jgi:hypothetical protein